MSAQPAWKRPARSRVRAIRDRLRTYYGRPRNDAHHAPLDELVLTVLSQNTNDRNRDVAYVRLRKRFPDWESVAAAPVEEVEEAIRPGGISKVKSQRIKAMLEVIEVETGGLDLGFLATAPREDALEFLESLPGVGRKTAACVLMFAYDRPEIPVDTHVYRVCTRLGLLRPKSSFEEAHEVMRAVTDPEDAFEVHVNLIRHGRRLCSARNPDCPACPLLGVCPYGKAATGRSR
jgi:endonuclease-3